MASPRRFVIRMILFLVAVGLVCGLLAEPLHEAFIANMGLNGLIIGVLLLGIVYNFRQTLMLFPEVDWIENYRKSFQSIIPQKPPKLLSSMATMLGDRTDGMSLSAQSMRSLLDGIASRLDESRDLSRYNIGLLIFLGLLGTFWGLLETVGSIRNVIDNTLIQHGIDSSYFKIEMELNSIEAIKNAVNSGLGAAFVSVSAITKELELGMFHWAKIDGITIKRTLSVLLNSKRYYSNATQIFKEEILGMLIPSTVENKT